MTVSCFYLDLFFDSFEANLFVILGKRQFTHSQKKKKRKKKTKKRDTNNLFILKRMNL